MHGEDTRFLSYYPAIVLHHEHLGRLFAARIRNFWSYVSVLDVVFCRNFYWIVCSSRRVEQVRQLSKPVYCSRKLSGFPKMHWEVDLG